MLADCWPSAAARNIWSYGEGLEELKTTIATPLNAIRETSGFEGLNWVAPYDRLLPLGERLSQFRQGDILQLPDPLSGHSEFLSNFFESFRFGAIQPVSLEDNLALAVVQHPQKLAKFVAHVLVSEQLERRLGLFITDDLAKFR